MNDGRDNRPLGSQWLDELLRRLTPEQKLAVAHRLRETAWDLAAAGVRLRRPELSEEQVQARVRAIFLRAVA